MISLLLAAVLSFFVCVLLIPLTITLAKKYHLVDDPQKRPHPAHVQKRVVPRAGGLPIFLAITISAFLFIPKTEQLWSLILAMFLLLVIGLLDDYLKDFSALVRFLFQTVAAAMVVFSGVTINFITNPLGGILYFSLLESIVLTVFWCIWIMNMVNWAKGVDGQMPGVILVASVVIGILSLRFYGQGDIGQLQVATLSFITAAASLAFLIFNWYPAKIFPGFSGSTILGLIVATLAMLAGAKLATALLVLLVPAIDFLYTFFRRVLSGKPPWRGDRQHLHHLLLQKGFSHQQIALFYIVASAILGIGALNLDSKGKLFAVTLVGAAILGAILWLNFFGGLSKRPDQDSG